MFSNVVFLNMFRANKARSCKRNTGILRLKKQSMDHCATKYTVRINNGRNDETGDIQLGNRIKDHQPEKEDKRNYTSNKQTTPG